MYDVAIIGAGPAGATLARLIGKTCNVLMLERRGLLDGYREPSPVKCCGGLLAPDAQNMLAHFGLGIPREVLVGPQLFTVRTIDVRNSKERYYQRHYINMDRESFDRYLVSLIPPNVDIRCNCQVRKVETGHASGKVSFSAAGRNYEEKARLIVAADGASSSCARRFISRQKNPRVYVAVQEWFVSVKALPYYSVIFDDEISDYFSWTIPKEEFLIVGAALQPGKEAHQSFERLKVRLSGQGFNLERSVKKSGSLLLRPMAPGHLCYGLDNLAFIGEAGGFISPTSGEGLSYAFRSALALADALNEGDEDLISRYEMKGGYLKKNLLLKCIKLPFIYNRNLRNLVMASGIRSMELHRQVKSEQGASD
ncbi:MAG: FAD-binding protein [Vulcanimicrobiota bacterium]